MVLLKSIQKRNKIRPPQKPNQVLKDAEKFMALEESYLERDNVSPEEARARALERWKRKISFNRIIPALFIGLVIVALVVVSVIAGRAQDKGESAGPYIVKDTENDSPGTNIVTRIVTLTAEVGGEPAPALQWKVDKGSGFEDIAGATNQIYRIGNAQVVDSGLYALFATNSAGAIQTTPVPLIVTEGED